MKHSTPDSMKFKKLQRRLGVPKVVVVGTLEMLWIATQKNAKRGDIGQFTNEEIAIEVEWEGDPDHLINSLVETGWLDRCDEHRLVVHDWQDHCPAYLKKAVNGAGGFATVTMSIDPGVETQSIDPVYTPSLETPPIRNLTKPNVTKPPPPTPSKPERVDNPDADLEEEEFDFDLGKELAERGVGRHREVAQMFLERGFAISHAKALLAHFDSKPGAWHPGALVTRFANARGELMASEGWPKPDHVPKSKRGVPDFDDWTRSYLAWCKSNGKPIPSDERCREVYDERFATAAS